MTFKVLHMIPAVQGKSSEIIIINNKKLTKYFYSKLLLIWLVILSRLKCVSVIKPQIIRQTIFLNEQNFLCETNFEVEG